MSSTLKESLEQGWVLPEKDYPPFTTIEELVTIEDMAKKLDVSRQALVEARFREPPLPFLRIGKRLFFAVPQVIWWLNVRQRTVPDKYTGAAARRMASGVQKPYGSRGDAESFQAREQRHTNLLVRQGTLSGRKHREVTSASKDTGRHDSDGNG